MDTSAEQVGRSATMDVELAQLSVNPRSVYADQGLTRKSKMTRLVHLLPGHLQDPVKCTLHAISLHQVADAEALSYRWGSTLASRTIDINGTDFVVKENLYQALVHLRLIDSQRVLWIDAICINQKDVHERNHQVQQMADIYSQARLVIAWLGPEAETSQAALQFLAYCYHRPRNRRELTENPGWDALEDLYQRDYWKRVWIVQEICLAREVIIVCGNTRVPWTYVTELRKSRMHCWTQYLSKGERGFMRSLLARIDHARETHQKKGGCILWTLLESFEESECQEIHDRIYGFLGLASDYYNEGLPVDYTRSVSQLYRDVIEFYYGIFRKDSSSPHSAQLMKFSEFFRKYLERHPRSRGALELRPLPNHSQASTAAIASVPNIQISVHDTTVIDRFLTSQEAAAFAASDLVEFLQGKLPYSHLGFWRDLIDPNLSEVFTVDNSRASATIDITRGDSTWRADEVSRPSASITSNSAFVTSNSIPGIAPPGSKAGDVICTFVDSHIALVLRPVREVTFAGDRPTPYSVVNRPTNCVLIGRVYLVSSECKYYDETHIDQLVVSAFKYSPLGLLNQSCGFCRTLYSSKPPKYSSEIFANYFLSPTSDFQHMEKLQPCLSRLTGDKTIELVATSASSAQVLFGFWPATLSIPVETLQVITKPAVSPKARHYSDRRLDIMPSTSTDTNANYSHSFQKFSETSELTMLQNDRWVMQHVHGPGYVGVTNLGSTGYISCVVQILYMLMPFRKVSNILQEPGPDSDLCAGNPSSKVWSRC
jgi:hypothetical protein